MTKDEILQAAWEAVQGYGFKSVVLQSGEDSGYSINELVDIIKEIKEKFPALIFISFGEIGIKQPSNFKKIGFNLCTPLTSFNLIPFSRTKF